MTFLSNEREIYKRPGLLPQTGPQRILVVLSLPPLLRLEFGDDLLLVHSQMRYWLPLSRMRTSGASIDEGSQHGRNELRDRVQDSKVTVRVSPYGRWTHGNTFLPQTREEVRERVVKEDKDKPVSCLQC